jgi:hypothetical protein
MTSFQKIEEAKFFLGLINDNFQDDAKCEYCVSAFLSACYSVMDHTLEEYFVHFHLKPRGWGLDIAKFHQAAVNAKNDQALEFIKLYCAERYRIDSSPLAAALLNLRNENTHSSMNLTPFGTAMDSIAESRFIFGILDIALPYFCDGLKGFVRSRQKALFNTGIIRLREFRPLFDDDLDRLCKDAGKILTNIELRPACKMYFDMLDGFVNTIRLKYPRW